MTLPITARGREAAAGDVDATGVADAADDGEPRTVGAVRHGLQQYDRL
ncbi:hypothetical protein [Halobaculum roseum]|uniref:Uncharacterized protein n=1 Tax=Halobaculum roseum TaxID=2175149 RepID=A0ABD5ML34_9EURY|nr:hypothetical protein [Halobaculum roseum]QZY02915.1 hypothetical protein K6T36_01575 [Halobaculum roseum]